MALTFASTARDDRPNHVIGDIRVRFVKVTFDDSYPTGGEAITPANFGFSHKIIHVIPNAISDVATKHVQWDDANQKLLIMVEDGTSGISAEAANASDQALVSVYLSVFGY